MPATVGISNLSNTRDLIPTQANDFNSQTNNASLTSQCEAVNQSNLQMPADVTADIPKDAHCDYPITNMCNLGGDLTKQEPWIDPNPNDTRQDRKEFGGLWIVILVVFVLLDEMQLLVIHKLAHMWSHTGMPCVLQHRRQGWPTQWVGRILKVLLLVKAIACVVLSEELDSCQMPSVKLWAVHLPDKPSKSLQEPDMYQHIKGCNTYLWAPSQSIALKQKFTMGDGNCWWRAIAQGQPQKWYTLKRHILDHAITKMDLDSSQVSSVRAMRKANVWADEIAVHATAHYLQRTVVVVSGQQIIMIEPHNRGNPKEIPIFIAHYHNHFSLLHKQQAQQILKQHVDKSPRTFAEYQSSMMDCHGCPLITYSTARSIPLHRRCHRMHADKAVTDLVRQLVFPTRHVPGDGIPSQFPASSYGHRPSHERTDEDDDDDDDEGGKPYGYVRREPTPIPRFNAKDYCQLGIVFGYVGTIVFCGLIGGGGRTHRNGPNTTLDHKSLGCIHYRSAESAPVGKDRHMTNTSRLGAVGTSHVPAIEMRCAPFASETPTNQQFPWSNICESILGASVCAGLCPILGLIRCMTEAGARYLSHLHSDMQVEANAFHPEAASRNGDKCPVSVPRYSTWNNNCPHELRNAAAHLRNSHGKACGGTARDFLGQLAWGLRFWGGALPCVGLLTCSSLACAGTTVVADRNPLMQLCLQDVGSCACAGQHTLCSCGLNSSQATNCLSIGKVFDLEFRQLETTQQEWKGTIAHHLELQISDPHKQDILDTSRVCISDLIMRKFDHDISNNFGSFPEIGDRMALAEQVRRVAQAENYALPRHGGDVIEV